MLRVILTAGGTGGHVFPALAVAQELKKQVPDVEILFIGSRYGLEQHWVRSADIEFVGLPVQGLLGRGWRSVGAAFAMTACLAEAFGIVGEFKPHVAVGFGSYASFAGVSASLLRGCPTVIHEQNAVPGLANRTLGRFVRKICLAMPDVKQRLPKGKTIITGNPVRSEIVALPVKSVRGKGKKLLVMGGSQGSRSINQAIIDSLPEFKAAGIEIRHQTGNIDYVMVRDAYAKAGWSQEAVFPFMEDMAEAYSWADLTVCRSGASTVGEIAVAGLPAVFVPYPYATHDHQRYNAQYLVDGGAALMLEDNGLGNGKLSQAMLGVMQNKEQLKAMAEASRKLGVRDAAARVVSVLREVISPEVRRENWKE